MGRTCDAAADVDDGGGGVVHICDDTGREESIRLSSALKLLLIHTFLDGQNITRSNLFCAHTRKTHTHIQRLTSRDKRMGAHYRVK